MKKTNDNVKKIINQIRSLIAEMWKDKKFDEIPDSFSVNLLVAIDSIKCSEYDIAETHLENAGLILSTANNYINLDSYPNYETNLLHIAMNLDAIINDNFLDFAESKSDLIEFSDSCIERIDSVTGEISTEIVTLNNFFDYGANKFNVSKQQFIDNFYNSADSEMSDSGRKVFRMDMEHVLYNEYRNNIYKIRTNFRRGLITKNEMEIGMVEIRLEYIQISTEKKYVYLLSRIANEAVLEMYDAANQTEK